MKEKSILSVDYKMISDVKLVISAHKRVNTTWEREKTTSYTSFIIDQQTPWKTKQQRNEPCTINNHLLQLL